MNYKKLIIEFVGAFFLVLAVGMTGNPLIIGATLMVMVYMGGHVSGAHYNPAVTFAVWMRKKISLEEGLQYMGVQLLGAVCAATLTWLMTHSTPHASPTSDMHILKSLAAEMLGTFALATVVLHVAVAKSNSGNSFYGLAIGFTILAMAGTFGHVSGGAFNPAVGCGPIIVDMFNHGDSIKNIWLYIVGPFAGAGVAALVYGYTNPED